jgi:hypothetical protein
MTFTGTPEALRAHLTKLEAAGTTGIIIGILPSRSGKFHPEPPTDPYVSLSTYTARATA